MSEYDEGIRMMAKGISKIAERLIMDLLTKRKQTIRKFVGDFELIMMKEVLKEILFYLERNEIEKAKKLIKEIIGG